MGTFEYGTEASGVYSIEVAEGEGKETKLLQRAYCHQVVERDEGRRHNWIKHQGFQSSRIVSQSDSEVHQVSYPGLHTRGLENESSHRPPFDEKSNALNAPGVDDNGVQAG